MTSFTTRRGLAAALLAAFALLVGGLASPATAAASTGKLKGVVTLDGKPVSSARVQLYRLIGNYDGEYEVADKQLKTDNTDSLGRYSFAGLSAKSAFTSKYAVAITDPTGNTVKTFRTVVAKRGKTVTKNVRLKVGASLTGTVNTSDGRSPAGLTVGVDGGDYNALGRTYDKLYPAFSTTVKADGTFSLRGVPGRSYDELVVSDGPYARQCFDSATANLADCAPYTSPNIPSQQITLAPGEQRTLPTLTATKFAPPVTKLSGKVTDPAGKSLKGITVQFTSTGVSQTAVTRSSGRYSLDASIPAGAYSIRFVDPKNVWATQYAAGRSVTVTPGHPISGLDAALKSVSTARIASKVGAGTAKVAFQIKRKATGTAPSGTLTLSYQGISKTATLKKGKAALTLTGLPKGSRLLVADYSGTSSTGAFHKIVRVIVK